MKMNYPGRWMTDREKDTLIGLGTDLGLDGDDITWLMDDYYYGDTGLILADQYLDIRDCIMERVYGE